MTESLEGRDLAKMFVSILTLGILISPVLSYTKPHIVVVVADDLGWDDVSFHGSNQIPTPTLDRLAKEGVILNNYYVSPLSTPTRAAFMTGKYASRLGVQHDSFHNQQPVGVPLTETFLPNHLRELGYQAHGVGKWHLGFFAKEYTPTYRGFDSFFGFWTNTEDYYSHVSYDNGYGLDLRRNMQLVYNESGSYSTELFTKEAEKVIDDYQGGRPLFLYVAHQAVHVGNGDDPLQVPEKYVKKFAGIKDRARRQFAGMVTTLDESLQKITAALVRKGMMKNTIIVFTTDNGGAAGGYDNSAGSNYPLRGSKNTFWEGGVRGVAFVHSPLLKMKGRICDELIHATDWLPTLYAAGGGNILTLGKIDGYNVWDTLSNAEASPRYEVLHGVDTLADLSGALRVGDYKLVVNLDDGYYGDWFPRPATPAPLWTNKRKKRQLLEGTTVDCTIREPHPLLFTHAPVCKPREKPCLFNIKWDPCEYHNIGEIMPNTMKVMLERFYHFANSSTAPMYPASDNSSRPDLHDGSWTFWRDNPQIPQTDPHFVYHDPMADLKVTGHGGSSAPFHPPDNEKIFKEKAKLVVRPLANITRVNTTVGVQPKTNHTTTSQHQPAYHIVQDQHAPKLIPANPSPVAHPHPPPPLPPVVHHVAPAKITHQSPVSPHYQKNATEPHKDHAATATVQTIQPDVIIEGIGNLLNDKQPSKDMLPTNAPFVPVAPTASSIQYIKTTKNPFVVHLVKTTEPPPSIDIQNMLMDDTGSGLAPTISPTKEFMLATKAPGGIKSATKMKPLSLGDVVSGRPAGSKTHGDKSLGAKLHSNEMQINMPQVYDVIDETENLPDNQGSKGTPNVPNVYDVIELDKPGTKTTSKVQSDTGSGMSSSLHQAPTSAPKPAPPPPPPPPPPPSPLSTFFKPSSPPDLQVVKPKPGVVPQVVQIPGGIAPSVHNFEGDIVMDGHKFHVKGTETGDTNWLMKDMPKMMQSDDVMQLPAHHTPGAKSRVPEKKTADSENTDEKPGYSEVTDVIDETPKQQLSADKYKTQEHSVSEKLNVQKPSKQSPKTAKVVKALVVNERGKNVSAPHVHGNGSAGITKKNDTNCEKPVQLESSDNAVVVSSVVIVVIASAMVVGVALVAMIAVVARHFQRPRNRDGGGSS